MRKNLGGWPARTKTIFDAAAHRRAGKALDRLYNAQLFISRTATYTDAPYNSWMAADSALAWDLLEAARNAVVDANDAAQTAAK